VPLRDLNTYKHLKGVRTGDMGTKFGYTTKDNGWAIFDNVRVPRTNMLMRMANVDKAGKMNVVGDMRVLYTTMMLIRTRIVFIMNEYMFNALNIALRYASVRRQFATIEKSKQERQILDYQTMQHILTPELAKAYVQAITSSFVRDGFREMIDDVQQSKFERMDPMHHLLSGFKAKFTDECCASIDKCRRSTGGAGFLSQAGFTDLF